MRDVLRTFAVYSGRSIVAGPEVDGLTVTASINDERWDVVLRSVLSAHGLRGTEDEHGIIRVHALRASADRSGVEPLVTRVYALRFISVEEMRAVATGVATPRGRVAGLPSRNLLVVTDVLDTHRTLSRLLGR